jgi:hypothetical protein
MSEEIRGRTIGQFPRVDADGIDAATALIPIWRSDMPDGNRSAAITPQEFKALLIAGGLVDQSGVGSAIAQHNADLSAHPGLGVGGSPISASQFEQAFTQIGLSALGLIVINHNLGGQPSGVTVIDETGVAVIPDYWSVQGLNAIALSVASFMPISGTWKVSIVI